MIATLVVETEAIPDLDQAVDGHTVFGRRVERAFADRLLSIRAKSTAVAWAALSGPVLAATCFDDVSAPPPAACPAQASATGSASTNIRAVLFTECISTFSN
jgi:hypothetical protein